MIEPDYLLLIYLFLFKKSFEKQIGLIKSQTGKQIKAIKEHGKQRVESNALIKKIDSYNGKDSSPFLKCLNKDI